MSKQGLFNKVSLFCLVLSLTSLSAQFAQGQDLPDPNASCPACSSNPDTLKERLEYHKGKVDLYSKDLAAKESEGWAIPRLELYMTLSKLKVEELAVSQIQLRLKNIEFDNLKAANQKEIARLKAQNQANCTANGSPSVSSSQIVPALQRTSNQGVDLHQANFAKTGPLE
jgi:hypothetical protein